MGASSSLVVSKPIKGPVKEGKIILIQARLPSSASRFSVNLVYADNTVAFHFNPRFDEAPQVIVCNTYKYMWGKEERKSNMPFSLSESFEMTITVRSDSYEVAVNGTTLLTYDHRVPYHKVTKLELRGDITVEGVGYHSEGSTSIQPTCASRPGVEETCKVQACEEEQTCEITKNSPSCWLPEAPTNWKFAGNVALSWERS